MYMTGEGELGDPAIRQFQSPYVVPMAIRLLHGEDVAHVSKAGGGIESFLLH